MKETKEKSWYNKYQIRKWSNKKILELIAEVNEKYPDMRFWQIMCLFGYEISPDKFYEESYDTYQQMLAVKESYNKEKQDKSND